MIQLSFDLPRRTALGRADYFVSACNAGAIGWIERWRHWPRGTLLIHGDAGSGKTHLAQLWCERAAATLVSGETLDEGQLMQLIGGGRARIAVDNADRACEVALLHLCNWCLERAGSVLITARNAPAFWRIQLPDLGSRLRAALAIEIGLPDDAVLAAVLVKHFADRQLRVTPGVVLYLVRNIERSFAAAAQMAEQLDAASLRYGRAVTVPLVRKLLAGSGTQSRPPSPSGVR
jgi:chromosomal replication initiation ATPase DnaA